MNSPGNPYTNQPPFSAPLLSLAGDWPLIATKLHPPRPGGTLVKRSRLLSKLKAAANRRLVLIKGAAGFGKTTLLIQWQQELCQRGRAVAWLALDQEDDLPQHFLAYLVHALSQVLGDQATAWSATFTASASPKAIIAGLINELQQRQTQAHLIIDDYHHITHPDIHQAMAYLIQHAPEGLQVLLGSRTEPPLSLERLRTQEQLLEIDATELRFYLGEIHRYFSEGLGIPLETSDIQRLQELTEGWIVGMQMTAMSPGLKTNPSATIEQLSQGIRVVSRYFNDIVFQHLPDEVHEFLLRTSILNRLHPDLCDAVTGMDNGDEMLHWIEQRNLFLSALDERGEWFRYHNLFAETLRARLRRHRDIDQAELHERASRWFAAQGLWAEAVRHALAAGKPESTLPHAEAGVQSLAREGDLDTLLRWLSQLPPAAREQNLHLQQTLAWTLAHHFRFEECEQLLDTLETLARREGVDKQQETLLELQAIRAVCAMLADAPVRARTLSEPLLNTLPREKPWVAGLICNVLSACYLAEARFQDALDVQRHQPVLADPEDNLLVSVYRASIMGQIYVRQADLNTGSTYYRRALEQAEKIGGAQSNGAIAIAVQFAEVLYERGQWEELDRLLANRLPLIDRNATLDGFLRTYRARIRQAVARNDRTQAETLLEHAMQIAVQRRWRRLQVGMLGERLRNELYPDGEDGARRLLSQLEDLLPKTVDAEDPSHQEMINQARLSRARLLLLAKNYDEAATQLYELAERLERRGRVLATFHIHTLRAGALWHQGQHAQALELLQPLLTLGERQGLLHSFIDAGSLLLLPLLQRLRQEQATDLVLSAYIDRLITHLQRDAPEGSEDLPALSERERQTLLLLADGKTNKEIARVLDISPDTVKWHLKNLYTKLGAGNRTQALVRARALGIQV